MGKNFINFIDTASLSRNIFIKKNLLFVVIMMKLFKIQTLNPVRKLARSRLVNAMKVGRKSLENHLHNRLVPPNPA